MSETVSLLFRYAESDYVRGLRAHYSSRLRVRLDIVAAIVIALLGVMIPGDIDDNAGIYLQQPMRCRSLLPSHLSNLQDERVSKPTNVLRCSRYRSAERYRDPLYLAMMRYFDISVIILALICRFLLPSKLMVVIASKGVALNRVAFYLVLAVGVLVFVVRLIKR